MRRNSKQLFLIELLSPHIDRTIFKTQQRTQGQNRQKRQGGRQGRQGRGAYTPQNKRKTKR